MASLDEFKAHMIGEGARANQFRVFLTFPSYVLLGPFAGLQAQFLGKATQLPMSLVEDAQVMYRGRQIHYPGDRTFQSWHLQVYQDESFNIRNALEAWQQQIRSYDRTNGRTVPAQVQTDMEVHQLDRNDEILKKYDFHYAWPTIVGPVQVDFEQSNTIEIFDVEFLYDYFTSPTGAVPSDGSSFSISATVNTPFGNIPLG